MAECYWAGRIAGNFYQSHYGAPNANWAPWAAADSSPNNWDRFVDHAGKNNTAVQWGGLAWNWPPVAYDTVAGSLTRGRGAFSQYDWGTNAAGMQALAANTSTAKAYMGAIALAIKNQGH